MRCVRFLLQKRDGRERARKDVRKYKHTAMGVDDREYSRRRGGGGSASRGKIEVVTLEREAFLKRPPGSSSLWIRLLLWIFLRERVFGFFPKDIRNESNQSSRYLPDWRIANETTSESIVNALCARTDAIILSPSRWTKTERWISWTDCRRKSRKAEISQETVLV